MTRKEKVLKAIELAQSAGSCKYTENGQPCCVIAQLATLEGVTVDQLKLWEDLYRKPTVWQLLNYSAPGTEKLNEYGDDFLTRLQQAWDGRKVAVPSDPEARRAHLRNMALDHFRHHTPQEAIG